MGSEVEIYTLVVGDLQTNCYVVKSYEGKSVFLIDPGGSPDQIKNFLRTNGFKAEAIVHTHGHADHIGADNAFSLPVYIHHDDGKPHHHHAW